MDILCFSTTDWDEIWGSRQQVMGRLAAGGQRVLFVERQVGPEMLLRDPAMRRRKRAAWKEPALRQLEANLWLWQPPLLPPGRYYSPALNRLGQRLLANRLLPVLRRLSFEPPLLWLYPPQSYPLLGRFGERLSVYHCIERFAGEQHGRKRRVMLMQEEALLRAVDLVFVHSEGLRRLYSPLTRRPIRLVPSAADVAHFQAAAEIDPELAALPTPRLVVMSTLDARLDVEMLACLAGAHPAWQLALVGQVRPERVDVRPLTGLPNVHFLGKRPFSELPALLKAADACLAPYVLNELTQFISPLKVYEYLAAGKPIASTDLPEVRPLAEWVAIAPDGGEDPNLRAALFAGAIERALREDRPELQAKRRAAALAHSWDRRVEEMWAAVEAVVKERA
jgi:glycosyltransferase involved in cell wall biosynthesis